MRLMTTALAVLLTMPAMVSAQIPTIEREALIVLYNATDGDNWLNNDGWYSATIDTECSWYGVTCSGGQITELRLSENQLTGTIPTELGNLDLLQALRMMGNDLSGNIPPELGSLGDLHTLYLDGNQLSGSIPSELGSLGNLQSLTLNRNQLTGSIPPQMGNLSSVANLFLGENQLSGVIPSELGNLANVGNLSLALNQHSGSIPPELGNLSNLQDLNLAGNLLSGSLPSELGNLTGLERLILSDNQLTGAIPSDIGNLSSLEELFLQGNALSGEVPPEFANLTGLLYFSYIDHNALWTDDPATKAYLDGWFAQWDETQTIPPADVAAAATSSSRVTVSWTPILYTDDGGGYWVHTTRADEVFADGFESGDTSAWGALPPIVDVTNNKSRDYLVVDGLDPDTAYRFVVRTITDAHANNQNEVISDPSEVVVATTLP